MTPPLQPETDPAQAHLLSLGQVSPVAIFRANAAGECVYVNERWTEITGISTTDSLGSGWARAIHPDDRQRIVEAWARAPSLQEFFQAECRIERDDGLRWVIAQAVPVLEDGTSGVPAEIVPRMFEPFFSTKEVGTAPGSGSRSSTESWRSTADRSLRASPIGRRRVRRLDPRLLRSRRRPR